MYKVRTRVQDEGYDKWINGKKIGRSINPGWLRYKELTTAGGYKWEFAKEGEG